MSGAPEVCARLHIYKGIYVCYNKYNKTKAGGTQQGASERRTATATRSTAPAKRQRFATAGAHAPPNTPYPGTLNGGTTMAKKNTNNVTTTATTNAKAPVSTKSATTRAPKAAPKADKLDVCSIRFATTMGHDTGLDYHFAEVTIRKAPSVSAAKAALAQFMEATNAAIAAQELPLAPASIIKGSSAQDGDGNPTIRVAFPKIKGHSKDGYAAYKKAMTDAKVAIRDGKSA